MKKSILFMALIIISINVFGQAPWTNGKLKISENKKFLQHENGKPFFWLGDTAWLLFQRLNREETVQYFKDRKEKGFNVVQCIFYQSYNDYNAYSDTAYVQKDLTRPAHTPGNNPENSEEYDFWDHADYITEVAAENGIYLAIAPTWGQLVLRDKDMTAEKATAFAAKLAEYFKNKPNIIWLNGGSSKAEINTDIWEVIGKTIKKHDPNHLMSFHPFGRTSSSTVFNDASWLDLNMFTSGHRNYEQDNAGIKYGEDNWKYVKDDLAKMPLRPTIDGEASFENLPQGLHDHTQVYWNTADVRRYAYWSVMAGACGHTYGENTVRQVHKKGENKGESGAKLDFWPAMQEPGSFQMQNLKNLVLSRPYFDKSNDQSVVAGNEGEKYDRILVSKGNDYLFAYTFTGREFTLNMGKISGKKVNAWWYDTRTGEAYAIGTFANIGTLNFNPPGEKFNGNDWVLVLDDSSKKFKKPGVSIY
ncbi:glycoside hydrolase family 140 protein [Lacihabitans sp. LS3-19]|uniref:glycoside hydrolase family 140 protein n=1 Tax=Lacihabitans sp. LS3-19 TaxID=2487335 RepID=UPI0020CD40FF|nr:glycoside hydrolase family 140 protein [Lacihabitans sp. LS3-19]